MSYDTILDGVAINTATSSEEIKSNIKYNTDWWRRGAYTNIQDMKEWRKTTPIAVVGGGPSLRKTGKLLKNYKYVIVCGSAHDYVMENFYVPDYCVVCDPNPLVNNYLTRINPKTKYLIASQCSNETFDFIQSRFGRVTIWHAGRDKDNDKFFDPDLMLVGGGCTVGTRSITIAFNFGFENIHLFGFDNCVTDISHAYELSTPEEKINNIIDISLGDVKFKMADYMVGQLFDFKEILLTIGDRVNFTIHGDGALKTLLDLGKARIENGR